MTAQAQVKRNIHKSRSEKISTRESNVFSKRMELLVIAMKMKKTGLTDSFVVTALQTAFQLEGVADLMHLWAEEKAKEERNDIIADIQDLLNANEQKDKSEELYIKFNDLDAIAQNIRAFKDSLHQIVIQCGGISKLSELTGIPQPSLSRFFNSNAMPQRATVLKIAKALDLDEIKIDILWSK